MAQQIHDIKTIKFPLFNRTMFENDKCPLKIINATPRKEIRHAIIFLNQTDLYRSKFQKKLSSLE